MHILNQKSLYLGICFLALFLPYVTTQTYLTTIYHNLGFISFSAIYFPYAITSLISPFIGRQIGVKLSIILGSLTYVIWIASVASRNYYFLIAASILNGIGSGLLWVHQGIYLNKLIVEATMTNTKDDHGQGHGQGTEGTNVGLITGIFFTIYSTNLLLGSSISIGLQQLNFITFIWIFFGVGFLSWILMFFIPLPFHNSWDIFWNHLPLHTSSGVPLILQQHSSIPSLNITSGMVSFANSILTTSNIDIEDQDTTPDSIIFHNEIVQSLDISQINVAPAIKANMEIGLNTSKTFSDHLANLYRSIKLSGFLSLVPLHSLLAFSIIFSYGTLPLLLPDSNITEVAKLFIGYGLISAIFAFIWGKMYDKYGEKIVLFIGLFILFFQYTILLFRVLYPQWFIQLPTWTWYLHGGISGAIDTAFISLSNITISKKYKPNDAPYLFAWYRFFYCLSLAIASWMNTVVSFSTMILIILGLAIVMLICYIYHIRLANSLNEL